MDFPHHENTVQAKLVQEEYSQSGEYCQYEANTEATRFFSECAFFEGAVG